MVECILFISVLIMVLPRDQLRPFMLRASALGMVAGDYQFMFIDVKVWTLIMLAVKLVHWDIGLGSLIVFKVKRVNRDIGVLTMIINTINIVYWDDT